MTLFKTSFTLQEKPEASHFLLAQYSTSEKVDLDRQCVFCSSFMQLE